MAVGHFAGFFMDRLFERIFDVFWEGLGLRGETGSGRASVGDMLIGQLNEKRWDELLGKFEKLKQLMLILGSVIEEVKGRQVTNESFLQWLGELIEGMYQGQYMLDTMEFQSNNSSSRFNHKSFDELQCVVKKLCDLESNVAIFLKILKHCRPLGGSVTYYLNMNDDRMFGRDLEKVQMINFLQSEELGDSGNVRILSITGGEGHGKTTLAAYFYNEIWVRNRFSLSVWLDGACLQDPTIFFGKLLDHLPSSSSATSVDAEQFVPLGETVKKRLRNEMFLLVIDNAHYLNMAIWSIVKDCLKSGKRGSKLIITSRMDEVIQVGTVESITLDAMRKGEYCCFFKNLVFGRNCPEEYVRLTMIAKEIASMLNGSPLAAKAMAARLKENISIQHWENILKTLNPEGTESGRRSSSSNQSTVSWLRTEQLTRRCEEAAQAAGDANLRVALMDRRLVEMQRQTERVTKSVQQLSDHIRPPKKARHSSDINCEPRPGGPSISEAPPVHNNQVI